MYIPFKKSVALYLIAALFIISVFPRVGNTAFVPSEGIAFDRISDINKIQRALEIKVVEQRLEALGLNQEEIKTRLTQLSDQQLHQLATKIDNLRLGQDSALGALVAILLILLLLILLLDLTGHRVIVTR